jgi:DNA-directed RNA polymerase subunit RPC12/RpoP
MASKFGASPEPSNETPLSPQSKGAVRVQKRDAEAAPTLREKICAECSKTFTVEAEHKFFICPECYRRRFARKPARKGETQVLIQIQCVECGAQDYLDFMPNDPANAYCRACYTRKKREPKNHK